MKKYIKPITEIFKLKMRSNILAGSVGVQSTNTLGDEYSSEDVTYSKKGYTSENLWED